MTARAARIGSLALLALLLALAAPALAGHNAKHKGGGGGGGEGAGAADLSVALSDSPDPAEVGELITYTARVSNRGPARATGVTVTDTLPASLRFVSASGSQGADCDVAGATVTCRVARINSGGAATISIAARPTEAGTVTNSVSASAEQSDPSTQDNQASTTTTVAEAPPPDPDPTGCSGHAWFVGIVYDEDRREDFAADLDHFKRFSDQLRATHCIPAGQSTILDFQTGTEANLKAELRRVAAAANQYPDSQLFFFLSSHGNASSGLLSPVGGSACPPTRVVGSFAALDKEKGDGEDGFLDDCELGAELARFAPSTRMFVAVDCSFCGGFSDSLTAASGTVPDGGVPTSSGVPAPSRVVVTGCAVTTECFGSRDGGNLYRHLNDVLSAGTAACDGWTAPGFPRLQGANLPVRGSTDGRCTSSEWFFAAVERAYTAIGEVGNPDHHVDHALSVQQQFRIKYGFDSLAEDLLIR